MKTAMNFSLLLAAFLIGPGLMTAGRVTAQTFTTLHSLNGDGDGKNPWAGLILSSNTLYGTAYLGGHAFGTVFAVNADGTGFTNLHHFSAPTDGTNSDGVYPTGGLILAGNTLSGTAVRVLAPCQVFRCCLSELNENVPIVT